MGRGLSVAVRAILRLAVVVSVASAAVVLGGAAAVWALERHRPDSSFQSYGDAVWWAMTTMTTVGYGDHVPVTTGGRIVAAGVMIAGVAVLGAVAAVVAMYFVRAVAAEEERALEAEAETIERRVDLRLDAIDERMARIEDLLTRDREREG